MGLVSLLTDTATEMAIPLLPAFLVGTLGAGALALGLVEGVADGVASLLKLWSGRLADRTGKARPFILAGYGLSSIVRPLLALATSPAQVLAVRVTDRVGKGLRSSPRDALLAASAPEAERGAAFGFHRAMDHAGAVLGPLVAVGILTLWTTDLRVIFALTAIPGALAVTAILLGVRERPAGTIGKPLPTWGTPALRRTLAPIALFTLGNASDIFLLLKAGEARAELTTLPLLWMGLHMVKSAASTPGGRLADRLGPRATLTLGWLLYAAIYASLAFAQSPWVVAALVMIYGLHFGLVESAEKVLVAGAVGPDQRGGAFGLYHLVVGLAAIPASAGFGLLWQELGQGAAFGLGAALALGAVVLLQSVARPAGGAQPG